MRYLLITEMHDAVNQLEQDLKQLREQTLGLKLLTARVFSLPPPLKGQELEPTLAIKVTQRVGQQALQSALTHYAQLYMQQQSESVSTRRAVRLPGAVCLRADKTQYNSLQNLVKRINQSKKNLQQLITVDSGLPSEARFPFVHQHFPGLITLNAYRTITLLQPPDSIHFGWANKHIIKKVTKDKVLDQLDKSLKAGRARATWTREQWAQLIAEERRKIGALPNKALLKIKRPVKVQPVARVWYSGRRKQTQLACPNPLLIICQPHQAIPDLGELLNYNQDNVTYRYKPEAQAGTLIIPRLKLWYFHQD